jgi:hypothetical protein
LHHHEVLIIFEDCLPAAAGLIESFCLKDILHREKKTHLYLVQQGIDFLYTSHQNNKAEYQFGRKIKNENISRVQYLQNTVGTK